LIRRQHEEMLHPELQSDWTFPVHAGGSLQSRGSRNSPNPVLELVKALMQVLSLSKPLQLETRLLRKDLLALFEVREFSDEARFENPSASLVFENLICDTCTMTRDLDLCRDEDVLPSMPGPEGEKAADKPWRCPSCSSEYNRIALEEQLIARIQALILKWQIQDLRCRKCGILQGDVGMFGEHCTCCGVWEGTVQRSEIKKTLGVMERVAHAYELKMLDRVVQGVSGVA
jgi:DNA polymerase epsilon subunit 1